MTSIFSTETVEFVEWKEYPRLTRFFLLYLYGINLFFYAEQNRKRPPKEYVQRDN